MKIALLGMGTIGSGVYGLLTEREDIAVKRVLDRRELPGAEHLRTERMEDILEDPEIDAVVELLGGVEPAYSYAMSALRAGRHLVTANKLMLSSNFPALSRAAAESGAQLRASACVGGGIPFLPNLLRARRADEITAVGGIVNGTTNLILDTMQSEGAEFFETLARAQRAGYAEADPSADIDGIDAGCKLAIAASAAFDAFLCPDSVCVAGIRGVCGEDMDAFRAMGAVCRLLARAEKKDGGVTAFVEPTLVARSAREASVRRNDNYLSYSARRSGEFAFVGQGAGRGPTACAVMGDLLDILSGAEKPEYARGDAALRADNALEAHRYYVRGAEPPFARKRVGERAWLTESVPVPEMHAAMAKARQADPGVFFAGVREDAVSGN